MIKKIAILTSGGDAPGMNAAVHGLIQAAKIEGIESYLVFEGYKGLYNDNLVKASEINTREYINRGGTVIYSARFLEFKDPEIRKIAKNNLDKRGIEALVVIGGDGSYKGAQLLHEIGVKTVGLPGTIDNDISSVAYTIGFDTALNTIVESTDKIIDTSKSHFRCHIVETMGRFSSNLALHAGLATGADIIITQERKMGAEEISKIIKDKMINGNQRFTLVMTSEHIFDDLSALAKKVEELSGIVTRFTILSHIQRGGQPSATERVRAMQMAIKTIEELKNGNSGIAIGETYVQMISTPILEALEIKSKSLTEKANLYNKMSKY